MPQNVLYAKYFRTHKIGSGEKGGYLIDKLKGNMLPILAVHDDKGTLKHSSKIGRVAFTRQILNHAYRQG